MPSVPICGDPDAPAEVSADADAVAVADAAAADAGGDGGQYDPNTMGMPIFTLDENQLGVHGAGDYAILIEGPIDQPTGFSLLPVSADAGGTFISDGAPIAGVPESLSDAMAIWHTDHVVY